MMKGLIMLGDDLPSKDGKPTARRTAVAEVGRVLGKVSAFCVVRALSKMYYPVWTGE